jgi:hypothetical protein
VEDDSQSKIEREGNMGVETSNCAEEGPKLQISMHAMSGTSTEAKTSPLFMHISSVKLVAILDSGSTTTFMDPSVIIKTNLPVVNHKLVKVTIANGNTLWTQAVTLACQYTIQGHQFSSDFRVLELEEYDLILGCD